MHLRGNGTDRLKPWTSTASLLATLLLPAPLFASETEPSKTPPAEVAEEATPEPEEVDSLIQDIREANPEIEESLLEQIKAQLSVVKDQIDAEHEEEFPGLPEPGDIEIVEEWDGPGALIEEPADEPTPAAEPAPDAEALIAAEKKRAEAEALIARLADAADDELVEIESALAKLGETSLVPLKLAALSDDFEVRTRAGAMARRLRWRLVCNDALLKKHPGLPGTLAGEDAQPRRDMIEALISEPQADYVLIFVECLADRDAYIRERGIDGLVLIGERFETAQAGAALEQAALNSDDKSVVLLSVAGLAEIGQVDIAALTKLFEQTEHAEVQRTVLMAAGYSRKPEALGLIERALKDPRWRVRAAGLEALDDISRNLEASQLGDIVSPLLTDPEPFLRANALRLVAKLKVPGASDHVWGLIEDGSIDEATGLETLASLEDSKAYQKIRANYDTATQAGDHADASRWMTYLSAYSSRAAVDTLLKGVIKDPSLREQWSTAIYIASRRSNSESYPALVAPLLLDEDEGIRSTVWNNFGRYDFREYKLAEEIDKGLARGDSQQRLWRLNLIYQQINIRTDSRLYDALADDDPAVVNLSLAMIAQLLINDSMGVDDLPYRSSAAEHVFLDRLGGPTRNPQPQKPGLSDAALEKVREALDHTDPLARVRAAALLYHMDKDRGEKVTAILKDAIRSGVTGRIATGLFAARSEHGDLLKGVDLLAISRDHTDGYLLKTLCSVMLQVGEPELIEAAVVIAEDFSIYSNIEFFASLVSTGSEAAVEQVKLKLLNDGGFAARRFIQSIVETNPDAAIEIGSAMLESNTLDSYDRRDILSTLIRTKKNDQLIPLLEDAIERSLASEDEYERSEARQYQQLLLQIDPEVAQKQIIGALQTGSLQEQSEAIQTLIQINEPSEPIVEMVLQTVMKREAKVDQSWGILVGWLTQAGQYPKLKEAVDRLPGPMQSAMLVELAKEAGPEDLDKLMAIKPGTAAVRDRISMIVAELTTKHPEARPKSLDNATPLAKVHLLSAAGQWEGGEALIRIYLDDEDPEIAKAALRGLAVARILDDSQSLSEEDAERFAKAVLSDDAFTAYLATEALVQLDEDRLRAVPVDKVSSKLAALRIASAGAGDSLRLRDIVRSVTRNAEEAGQTELRFVMLAALNKDNESDFTRIWQSGRFDYLQGGLMARAVRKFRSSELLLQSVYGGQVDADDPDVLALVQEAVLKAEGKPDMHVGMYLDRGLIKTIPTDQIGFYVKSLSRWSQRSGMLSDHDLLKLLGPDNPTVRASLQKIMQEDDPASMHAAKLLYLLDGDDTVLQKARDSITKINPDLVRRNGLNNPQINSLATLRFMGDASDAKQLLQMHPKYSGDDWQTQMAASQLLSTAAQIAPDLAREHLRNKPQTDADNFHRFYHGEPVTLSDALAAMVIDEVDPEAPKNDREPLALTSHLATLKQGENLNSRVAQPPWDYYGNQETSDRINTDEAAQLERDLALTWIKTGQFDQEQGERLSEFGYIYQEDRTYFNTVDYEQRLLSVRDDYCETSSVIYSSLSAVSTPVYYAALDYIATFVPTSASADEAIEQLAPFLQHEDPLIAARAARVAAVWRGTALKDQLLEAVARPDSAGVEAAWASARLLGPDALDAVLERAKASNDFDERIELACLLTLLGEADWAPPVLTQANRLLAVQQLRGRALQPVQLLSTADESPWADEFHDHWRHERQSFTTYETIIDGRIQGSNTRWEALLHIVTSAPAENTLSRRLELTPLPTDRRGFRTQQAELAGTLQPLALRVDPGKGLSFGPGVTNNLPIPDLVGTNAPFVMHLEKQESSLFNATLTQLAGEGLNGRGLESAWRDWLEKHATSDPDALWRLGVTSATQSLTDPRWWRRALARERLQRLTGQSIEQPALFDNEQWASLQQQWESWGASDNGASARAAISAAALEAGLIDEAPSDDAAELNMLIRMAGWGDKVQSNAALHRLNLWPDQAALIKAAEAWQNAPRTELRAWFLQQVTDQPRIYAPADADE